jgi:4'-phosphopantetheinyl transferase
MKLHTLAPGDVYVRHRLTGALDDDALRQAVALLPPDERARHSRLRVEDDRREFAAAHALLRTTLSEFADVAPIDWRFDTGPHGKPALAAGLSVLPLSFNLSHARGLVACAVALAMTHVSAPARSHGSNSTRSHGSAPAGDGSAVTSVDVGLDVENITQTRNWRGIASRYFAAAELAWIDRASDAGRAARFFESWTLKEAFAKALGVGLSQALDATLFEVTDGVVTSCTLPPGVDAAVWQFGLFTPGPDHRMAVAVSDGSARPWRIEVRAAGGAER